MKVLYIDFCNTLCRGYSLDKFYKFVAKESGIFFTTALYLLKLASFVFMQDTIKNYFIKLYTYDYLDSLSEDYSRQLEIEFINPIIKEAKELSSQGYKIVIVSAALSDYIEKINFPFHVDKVIAASYKDKKMKMVYGEDKVNKIKKWEKENNFKIIHRISISDHISDLPMLEYADSSIVVNPNSKLLEKKAKENFWKVVYD